MVLKQMLKYMRSGAFLATLVTATAWGGQAAQAQSACGTVTQVSPSTSVNCTLPAKAQDLSCDAIPNAVSHRMKLGAMSGVEISVQSASGNPTLLIDGPDGCFYALANDGSATIPGFWSDGEHRIYVGGGAGNVTLQIQAD